MTYFYKRISGTMQQLCRIDIEINHYEIENISNPIFCEYTYNKSL